MVDVRCETVKVGNAKGVASYEQRGLLYREGFIDDHERPIEPILTPLKAATAKARNCIGVGSIGEISESRDLNPPPFYAELTSLQSAQ